METQDHVDLQTRLVTFMNWIVLFIHAITLRPQYYTNTNHYYQITGKDTVIYGATNGGVIAYDLLTQKYKVLTNSDGLWMNRQNCIALDSTGYIWAGSQRGLSQISTDFDNIQIYPVGTLPCAIVTTLHCIQDTMFVGTQDGILVIDMKGTPDFFSDDVTLRIYESNGLSSANITSISTGDEIWIGTDSKLNRLSKDFSTNTIYGKENGLLDNYINSITVVDTNIYVGTDFGLNVLSGDHFDTLLTGYMIKAIEPAGDSLLLVLDSARQVGIYFQGSIQLTRNGLPSLAKVKNIENINGKWYCGIGNRYLDDYFGEGIGLYDPDSAKWRLNKNACLASNHICDISANDSGVFVALGRRSAESRGFGWLTNSGDWINYSTDSILPSNHMHRCVPSRDGKVWFGINYFGKTDTVQAISLDPTTRELFFLRKGYKGMDSTVAIWDMVFDLHNNMFLSLAGPSDRLWVIDSAMNTTGFLGNVTSGFDVEIAVDSSYRVWITTTGREAGVMMIDTKGTLFNRSDDESSEYSTSDGLLSNAVLGCIVDKKNVLYIADSTGLSIFDADSFRGVADISEGNGEVLDVQLDPEGRIWLMTRTGFYYYDPAHNVHDGWSYLELGVNIEFLTGNEAIQVQGFEFDPLRKCFWLGGETGLLKLAITFDQITPPDSIIIYPNPVVNASTVRIKNVPADTRVSIYTTAGRCITKDLTPNTTFGEVVWEIPPDAGSGLYFALIRSSAGNTVRKFAIIK